MQEDQSIRLAPAAPRTDSFSRRVFHAAAKYRGPVELGWYDFITLFRRSFLGPLWATTQMALWIATITLILHERLGDGIGNYAVYVGLGFFAWDFISWSLGEGPNHLFSKGTLLKNIPVDISAVTIRRISFLFFRSVFQLPVPVFILIFFGEPLTWNALIILPVAVIFLINSFSCLTICGVLGVYIRDFEFIIPTMTRFLFFTTPIFWQGDRGVRRVISDYNPFSYFIEMVRAPLSGSAPSALAWTVVGVITVVSFLTALWLQSRFRSQIIYRI
ncbi:MAG: ABC transporter permease [Pseudomonadota bacterium]